MVCRSLGAAAALLSVPFDRFSFPSREDEKGNISIGERGTPCLRRNRGPHLRGLGSAFPVARGVCRANRSSDRFGPATELRSGDVIGVPTRNVLLFRTPRPSRRCPQNIAPCVKQPAFSFFKVLHILGRFPSLFGVPFLHLTMLSWMSIFVHQTITRLGCQCLRPTFLRTAARRSKDPMTRGLSSGRIRCLAR